MADILREHGPAIVASSPLTTQQLKALRAAQACRTAALGGHLDRCGGCGDERPSYNSCRDRHCPTCQGSRQRRWVQARMEQILPVQHFHVVFTLPAELRGLTLCNPRRMHGALFDAARNTLAKLGKQRLNGVLGVTAVLHTWTRELHFHPHLHCVVTAGAMDVANSRWSPSRSRFLFPVRLMSDLFRSQMLKRVGAMHDGGVLRFAGRATNLGDPTVFARLQRRLYRKKWVVYAKRPFTGPAQVFQYLGRYTHRVAISDHRVLDVTAENVRVATRDDGSADMTPRQFVSRLLLHVLPSGFHKIRHFGLYAPTHAKRGLLQARRHLEEASVATSVPATKEATEAGAVQGEVGEEPEIPPCPRCGGHMRRHAVPRARAPPLRRSW